MFKKLGNLITKKPLAFIAIWAVILIISAFLAMNLNSHLLYDTSSFTSSTSESRAAENLIKTVFPDTAKSQLIVAVHSDNETARRTFVNELNAMVMRDPAIYNVTNTTSVYEVQSTVLETMTPELYHSLYDAMDRISDGNRKLYDATDDVRNSSDQLYWLWDNVTETNSKLNNARATILGSSSQLYDARDQIVQAHDGLYQIKGAIDVLIGMPAYFTQAYASTDSSLDDANRTSMAIGATQAFIMGNVPSSNQALALGYLQAFEGAWNASSAITDPGTRAQTAITAAGPAFISSAIPASQQALMLNIVNNFPLSAYPAGERDFCVNAIAGMQGITDMSRKQQLYAIYDLGESVSSSAIDDMVITMAAAQGGVDQVSIREIYNFGRNPSDAVIGDYLVGKAIDVLKSSDAGKNMSAADLQNAEDVIRDAWSLGRTATKQDVDKYVMNKAGEGLNDSEKRTLEEIWSWGRNPDASVIRAFVMEQAGKGLNASENKSLAEIYDLGRNASKATIQVYVIQKAAGTMNISGNLSYFYWIMDSGRNLTDGQIKNLADEWAATHSYDNPHILPPSLTSMIESGSDMLYIIELGDNGSSANATASALQLMADVEDLLKKDQYREVNAHVTGTPAIVQDMTTAAMRDISTIDQITIPLVLLIMGVYFLSLVAPFVPLAAIGVAIVTGMGALYLVTFAVGDLYNMAQAFLIVVMLGAGIDYCVFILSRYSEERGNGGEVKASVVYAIEHAGESIACSGIVAAIGFGSLMLIDKGIFMSIGVSAALGIFIAMCAALTLIPAIITIAGDRIFWPRKIGRQGASRSRMGPLMRGVTKFSLKHWKAVILALIVVLVPMTYITLQLQLGNDTLSMLPDNVESKAGFDMIQSVFGSGNIDRTSIVVTMPDDIKDTNGNYSVDTLDRIEEISRIAAGEPGVGSVYSMTRPYGSPIQYDNLSVYSVMDKNVYQTYMDKNTGSDGRTTVVYVAFEGSPYSAQASNTITDLHAKMDAYEAGNGTGMNILIGGSAASMMEYQDSCSQKYPLVVLTVFGGIFLILLFLLRSVAAPPKLFLAMFSVIVVTLGAFTLAFQYLMQNTIFWILPVALFCILIGLGGDYVIFMMSRVREEINKGKSDDDAILDAVQSTGPVILLCGAVMGTAFGSMMASSMIIMKEIGFVVSFGIILDATVMIWVIIPALMMAFRKYNWWFPGNKKTLEVIVPVKKE